MRGKGMFRISSSFTPLLDPGTPGTPGVAEPSPGYDQTQQDMRNQAIYELAEEPIVSVER